jgi:hypothetical protein
LTGTSCDLFVCEASFFRLAVCLARGADFASTVHVKNKRERLLPVRPPGVEKTSRLRSRDPVASGVKCGPHIGLNSKMKSWTVSW